MAYKYRSKKALRAASVTATDAVKNFGELVDRVREEGVTYVIERHGRPVAQIGPVERAQPKTLRHLIAAIQAAPKLDDEVVAYIEEGIARANTPSVPKNRWAR